MTLRHFVAIAGSSARALRFPASSNAQLPIVRDFLSHGVLCLTSKKDNIPVWAYYADDHKGVCVEFEINFSKIQEQLGMSDGEIEDFMNGVLAGNDILSFRLEQFEFAFTKVKYEETLPTLDFNELENIGNNHYSIKEYIVRNSFGVKFKDWTHEDEFRLISHANSKKSGLLDLKNISGFIKVTGLIMGSKIKKDHIGILHKFCSSNEINLYATTCKESAYEMIISNYVREQDVSDEKSNSKNHTFAFLDILYFKNIIKNIKFLRLERYIETVLVGAKNMLKRHWPGS